MLLLMIVIEFGIFRRGIGNTFQKHREVSK
jgi:hypothetical protein